MKILRSVSRRGFNVGTAGWFTVLKPNTWFPASRLRKTPPGFGKQARGSEQRAMGEGAPAGVSGNARTVRWLAMERSADDHSRMRSATAILGGIAITAAMLWWIMHP